MYARVATWWTILRICLEERLVYRADFALGTLMRFLPIITQIFLWTAIFEASGKNNLAGYTLKQFIAYYLLTMIARAFSSMPGLASGIARQIRDGEIKKYLIQPVDMLGFMCCLVASPISWHTTPWRWVRSHWSFSCAVVISSICHRSCRDAFRFMYSERS